MNDKYAGNYNDLARYWRDSLPAHKVGDHDVGQTKPPRLATWDVLCYDSEVARTGVCLREQRVEYDASHRHPRIYVARGIATEVVLFVFGDVAIILCAG